MQLFSYDFNPKPSFFVIQLEHVNAAKALEEDFICH